DIPLGSYYAACFTARCVPLARRDKGLGDAAARQAQAHRYADRAVTHLHTALAKITEGLERLPDEKKLLAPLEGHPGFAETLRELDALTKQPSARPGGARGP